MRIWIAFFTAIIMVIATVLVPVAYFGDKNPRSAAILVVVAFLAALIFLVAIFYGV